MQARLLFLPQLKLALDKSLRISCTAFKLVVVYRSSEPLPALPKLICGRARVEESVFVMVSEA